MTTATTKPTVLTPDVAQLAGMWDALVAPGDVHEVRLLKVHKGGPLRLWGQTHGGYFDNQEAFLKALSRVTGADAGGVYITLNPVDPDLLAREGRNRLVPADSDGLTKDHDIVKRTGLLIDTDTTRKSGISAADDEVEAALFIRDQIRDYLADNGFPEPLAIGMSGNGGHILLRVDLPNDAESTRLVENFLKGLHARFGTEQVKVDCSVANASRITKVFGSVAAKGANTDKRPWRIARGDFNPGAGPVPRRLLEAIAAFAPQPEPSPEPQRASSYTGPQREWTVPDLLGWNGLSYTVHQNGDATIYKLVDRCLTSHDHTDGAALTEQSNGRLGYRCHHEHCLGKGWQSVRDALRITEFLQQRAPRISLNGHAANGTGRTHDKQTNPPRDNPFFRFSAGESPENEKPADLPEFPLDVFPTVARRFIEEASRSLMCPAGMVGTPFLAHVAGVMGNRHALKVKNDWVVRPIFWTLTIAESGTAKSPAAEHCQKLLNAIQSEAFDDHKHRIEEYDRLVMEWDATPKKERLALGPKPEPPMLAHVYTTDTTIEGLAKMLGAAGSKTSGLVVIRDELSGWVASFGQYKGGKGGEREQWLTLWNGGALKSDRASRESYYVLHPAVSVSGGTQPDKLASLSAEAEIGDGFIPRFLFEMPDVPPMPWTDDELSYGTQQAMIAKLKDLRASAQMAILSDEARAAYIAWFQGNTEAQEGISGLMRSYYAKLPQQLARLALVLHVLGETPAEIRINGITPEDAPITEVSADTMEAAITLVEYYRATAHLVLPKFGAAQSEGRSAGLVSRVRRILRKAAPEWVTSSQVSDRLGGHVPAAEYRAALDALVEEEFAEYRKDTNPEGGRPVESWRAIGVAEAADTPRRRKVVL
jgi:hypothetical protein